MELFEKKTAFRNAVNMRVLEHLGGRKDVFLPGYQSVDFASKHCLKRYVYSGFGDFLFSEKGSLWKEKYGFFDSIRVRPKIAQVLRI